MARLMARVTARVVARLMARVMARDGACDGVRDGTRDGARDGARDGRLPRRELEDGAAIETVRFESAQHQRAEKLRELLLRAALRQSLEGARSLSKVGHLAVGGRGMVRGGRGGGGEVVKGEVGGGRWEVGGGRWE